MTGSHKKKESEGPKSRGDLVRGLPDGITHDLVPWGAFDALFIGGGNVHKFGATLLEIIRIAKGFGLWVHWGRSSTPPIIHYCKTIGCDSVDGSAMARFVDDRLKPVLPSLTTKQHVLFSDWEVS